MTFVNKCVAGSNYICVPVFTFFCIEFFSEEKLPHIVKAAGPVLVAPVGREILLEMSNKVRGI